MLNLDHENITPWLVGYLYLFKMDKGTKDKENVPDKIIFWNTENA